MNSATYYHANRSDLGVRVTRSNSAHGHQPVLQFRADGSELEIYLTEAQLDQIAEAVSQAVDDRPLGCRTCDQMGTVTVGHEPSTRDYPGDPIERECPVCSGTGTITFGELEETYDGVFPTEEDAVDDLRWAAEARAAGNV